jgi:hypothetical protein
MPIPDVVELPSILELPVVAMPIICALFGSILEGEEDTWIAEVEVRVRTRVSRPAEADAGTLLGVAPKSRKAAAIVDELNVDV